MYMYMALGVPIDLCRSMLYHQSSNTASDAVLPIGCTLAFSIITTAHAGDRHPAVVVVRVCVPALAVALLGLCVTARFTLHAVAAVAVAVAAAAPRLPACRCPYPSSLDLCSFAAQSIHGSRAQVCLRARPRLSLAAAVAL